MLPTTEKSNLCQYCFSIKSHKEKVCPCCGEKANAPKISNTSKHPTALREGAVLAGKYIVGKLLGKGGFGMTYLCYDLKNERKVAVKEFMPDTLAYRESGKTLISINSGEKAEQFKGYVKKFFDEAKTVSRFNGNPGIISVYEFFYENNTAYFSMEYLEGMDLKTYISKNGNKLSEKVAVYIIDKVLDALTIVHSTGILHRDISPDNIYICNDGRIKLIDFGAARQVIGEESKSLSVILKPGFAPVEQYQSKGKQGPWTDIYALGATLYYTITGKMLDDAVSRGEDDSIDFNGVSPEVASIISKMVAVKKEDRYQSVIEIKYVLQNANLEMESPVEPVDETDSDQPSYEDPSDVVVPPKPFNTGTTKRIAGIIKKITVTAAIILAALAVIGIFFVDEDYEPYYIDNSETNDFQNSQNGEGLLTGNEEVVVNTNKNDGAIGTITIPEKSNGVIGSGICGDNVQWELTDYGMLYIFGTGDMYDYDFRTTPWYSEAENITEVVISDGVTSIGNCAFYGCKNMTKIVDGIPNSVIRIGDCAFDECRGLTEVIIPDSVTSIGACAFYSCTNLSHVSMGKNVESIGDHAFYICLSLTSLTIPYNTEYLGEEIYSNYTDAIIDIYIEGRSQAPEGWDDNWVSGFSLGYYDKKKIHLHWDA